MHNASVWSYEYDKLTQKKLAISADLDQTDQTEKTDYSETVQLVYEPSSRLQDS